MNFKLGEKIVCVKAGNGIGLIKNNIYTVIDNYESSLEENVVEVLEAIPPDIYKGYQASRFRKALPSDLKNTSEELSNQELGQSTII